MPPGVPRCFSTRTYNGHTRPGGLLLASQKDARSLMNHLDGIRRSIKSEADGGRADTGHGDGVPAPKGGPARVEHDAPALLTCTVQVS